jgi:DNA-binding MarR family transcriptional regulator
MFRLETKVFQVKAAVKKAATKDMSQIRTHLSAIQSRILVALFQSEGRQQFVPNESVLEKTGIAQSTWSEEQKRLIEMGLLEKKAFKTIRTNNVCRIVNFRLTSRGRTVAFNLANISRIIVRQGEKDPLQPLSSISTSARMAGKDFEFDVMESIEVALDSFGINLVPLVKSRLPDGTRWDDVSRHPEMLSTILRDLFGEEGSNTVESMIAENLKSRFDVVGLMAEDGDLNSLIARLRQERVVDIPPAQISAESRE